MSKGFVNIKYLAIGLTLGKDHHVLCETATVKGDDAAFAASVKQVIAGMWDPMNTHLSLSLVYF